MLQFPCSYTVQNQEFFLLDFKVDLAKFTALIIIVVRLCKWFSPRFSTKHLAIIEMRDWLAPTEVGGHLVLNTVEFAESYLTQKYFRIVIS